MTKISNDELERRFDVGEDLSEYLDTATLRRPNLERAPKRISMDVPESLVRGLDRYAARAGVNRQAVIKIWLTERLDQEDAREAARESAARAAAGAGEMPLAQ